MSQPTASFHIIHAVGMKGFIATAGEFLPALQESGKTKLFCLGRVDIKKCYRIMENRNTLVIPYRDEMDSLSNHVIEFSLECETADGGDGVCQIFMAVNMQLPFIETASHTGSDNPNHPYDSQQMICVFMSNKNMVNV